MRNVLIRDVLTPLAGRFPTPANEIGFADGWLPSFRHLFCSLCANSGVPQQMVLRVLVTQDSQLQAHFCHVHDPEARRQIQKSQLPSADGAGGGQSS